MGGAEWIILPTKSKIYIEFEGPNVGHFDKDISFSWKYLQHLQPCTLSCCLYQILWITCHLVYSPSCPKSQYISPVTPILFSDLAFSLLGLASIKDNSAQPCSGQTRVRTRKESWGRMKDWPHPTFRCKFTTNSSSSRPWWPRSCEV